MTVNLAMPGSIVVEGKRSIHIGSQAYLLNEDRELAWAENHVVRNPAYKWVLGKFVQADQANQNGHIFALDELQQQKDSVLYAPMNMLHKERYIVGAFVANEMVYPTGTGEGPQPVAEAAGLAVETTPYLEALAAFWRYYFKDEYEIVERAHADGSLFFSMECVPDTVICAMDGCGREFAYKGKADPSYCSHLNTPRSRRQLHTPHFTAGALIVPPVRPGWRNADIKELSGLLETYAEEAEMAFEQASEAAPHLGPREWENMMAMLVEQTAAADARETAADGKGPDLKKVHDQNKNKPHAYTPLGGDGGVSKNAPCKKCGKGKSGPMHGKAKAKSALEVAREATGVRSALDIGRETAFEGVDAECERLLAQMMNEQAADVPMSERKASKKKGNTAYGTSYPVNNLSQLSDAIQAWGRAPAGRRSTLKSFLLRKARQLGASASVIKRIQALSA